MLLALMLVLLQRLPQQVGVPRVIRRHISTRSASRPSCPACIGIHLPMLLPLTVGPNLTLTLTVTATLVLLRHWYHVRHVDYWSHRRLILRHRHGHSIRGGVGSGGAADLIRTAV